MSNEITFQLDPNGGEDILREMAAPTVKRSADAIAARAAAMVSGMSTHPPEITSGTEIGIIRRGIRFIATVRSTGSNPHSNYIGRLALSKSKDAGRVS